MRFLRLILLFAPGLLAACGKESSGPRLDFIADGRATTTNDVVIVPPNNRQPGDTFEVRVLAETRDNQPLLRRVTISVQETYFGDLDQPEIKDPERTYLQATPNSKLYLFSHRFGSSTNSGRQVWTYTAEDEDGRKATRSLRVTVRQPDSTSALHSYTVRLQAPQQRTSRAALASLRGYVLPPHATDTAAFQELVDLLYVPTSGGPTLAAPSSDAAAAAPQFRVRRWVTRRATRMAVTGLNKAAFDGVTTAAALGAIIDNVTPAEPSTPALGRGQVVAFVTADGRQGLLHISEVRAASPAMLTLEVKVRRR